MRLLADENLPLPSIRLLREAGYDIEAIAEFAAGAADWRVLAHAKADGQILVTFDRDFGELIYRRRVRPLRAGRAGGPHCARRGAGLRSAGDDRGGGGLPADLLHRLPHRPLGGGVVPGLLRRLHRLSHPRRPPARRPAAVQHRDARLRPPPHRRHAPHPRHPGPATANLSGMGRGGAIYFSVAIRKSWIMAIGGQACLRPRSGSPTISRKQGRPLRTPCGGIMNWRNLSHAK